MGAGVRKGWVGGGGFEMGRGEGLVQQEEPALPDVSCAMLVIRRIHDKYITMQNDGVLVLLVQ